VLIRSVILKHLKAHACLVSVLQVVLVLLTSHNSKRTLTLPSSTLNIPIPSNLGQLCHVQPALHRNCALTLSMAPVARPPPYMPKPLHARHSINQAMKNSGQGWMTS
jgi:hypothetical protein